MAEQLLTSPRTKVPHHGPVRPDCPVECLLSVLSLHSFNPLSWAQDAPFDPPRTVSDVVDLYARHQLRMIRGLGLRRTSEIEAALVLAGLDLTRHRVQPADAKGAAT
jgi:hypothetical protein